MKRFSHSIVFTTGAVAANALLLYVFILGPTQVLKDARRSAAATERVDHLRDLEQPGTRRLVSSAPHAAQVMLLGENSMPQATALIRPASAPSLSWLP